jgi:hypothetical protein
MGGRALVDAGHKSGSRKCGVGFNFTPLPLLLAKAGAPVDRIASVNSIVNLPGVLGLLIAPVVDVKPRRKNWLAIGTFGTALAACLYFSLIGASHLMLMTVLIFAGALVANQLTSLQQRLVKTGGRLVKDARYYWLLLAESHLTRRLFASMVRRIEPLPVPGL